MTTTCPHCRGEKVRRSKSGNRGWVRLVNRIVTCLRCYRCGRKFYVLSLHRAKAH